LSRILREGTKGRITVKAFSHLGLYEVVILYNPFSISPATPCRLEYFARKSEKETIKLFDLILDALEKDTFFGKDFSIT
jgi:hypothetical protein